MSKQVNTADEQDEIQHMDYIYMVNDDKLMIRMNAELDHHLAEEMRQVIDDVIDKRGVTHIVFDFLQNVIIGHNQFFCCCSICYIGKYT